MISRRHFFQTAGLTVAGSALPGIAAEPRPALPRSPVLSQALLDYATRNIGVTAQMVHSHAALRSDLFRAANALGLVRAHFLEVGIDAQINAAAQKVDRSGFSRTDALEAAYIALKGYDPTLTRVEFSRTEINIDAGLEELRTHGITRVLGRLTTTVATVQIGHISLPRTWDRPHIVYVQDGFCPTWSFYVDSFSAAFFILTLFGCGPEPLFPLLCPALLTFATMLGFASVLSWVVC